MKLRQLFLAFLMVFVMALSVACKPETPDPEPQEPQTISEFLQASKNGDEVKMTGVVYAVAPTGYYMSDSSNGKIYVSTTGLTTTPAKGDEVEVKGTFSLSAGFAKITAVSSQEVKGSGKTPLAPTNGSIATIKDLLKTDKTKTYGNYYSVVGTLSKDGDLYKLKDEDNLEIVFSSDCALTKLDASLGKRVTLPVVVYQYDTTNSTYSVLFVDEASAIVDTPIAFATLLESAKNHIERVLPTSVYVVLDLPTVHEKLSYLTYTWSVDENPNITIVDNKPTITLDKQDHEVDLKCLVSNGTESQTLTFKLTIKGLDVTEQTVSEFYKNVPTEEYQTVKVSGVVVGSSRNQGLTLRTLYVQDKTTSEVISVDFSNTGSYMLLTSEQFKSVKLGDEISVVGQYRISDRPVVMNVMELVVKASDVQVTRGYEEAYVVNSKETFENLAANYSQYVGKLIKFENPFMNYSTSSTPSVTNWVQLGYDETSGKEGFASGNKKRKFALLIAAHDENLGSTDWRNNREIPFLGQPAQQFGITFYGYATYISDSYLQIVIPEPSCFIEPLIDQVKADLFKGIPSSVEEGKVGLLTTHEKVTGDIVWTSSNPSAIDPTTGAIGLVTENTDVTLTATFTLEGKEQTLSKVVTIIPSTPLTVTEVLSQNNETSVKFSGLVLAYASDGNTKTYRYGLIVLDKENNNTVLLKDVISIGGESSVYGAFLDSKGNEIKIGDEILVKGLFKTDDEKISGTPQTGRKHVDVNGGAIEVLSSDNNLSREAVLTITTNDELAAFAKNIQYGTIVKLVGTAENPIYLGGSATKYPFNIKVFKTNAVDNNGTKYAIDEEGTSSVTFVLKSDVNAPNAGGDKWYQTLFGIEKAFVGPTSSVPAMPYVGEIYVSVCNKTSSYYQMSIVYADLCTMKAYTPAAAE